MGNIMDAMVPESRWPEPQDSDWDIHYPQFEMWVNDLFERDEYRDLGFYGDFDSALESELLFGIYMDEYNSLMREP
jgi:hypothetical protein